MSVVYPTALVTLMLFIAYQVSRIVSHPSLALGVFTAIDAVVIYLIWREWRHVRGTKVKLG